MLFKGQQLGKYKIGAPLGSGGFGSVYLAHDTWIDKKVAIKVPHRQNLDFGELLREPRLLASVNHPNIVAITTAEKQDGVFFIVMEYVRGETLAEKIKRRAPLTTSEKLKLMTELCAGLGHAHEAGIIHRDIKPANLMIDQHGRLKILDFGIARVAEGSMTRVGVQVTQFNMRIGTPGYMSPEQFE